MKYNKLYILKIIFNGRKIKLKTLYFDCSSGISGNMVLGALLEIVGDEEYLLNELKKLNIDGYEIKIYKKAKNGITGTYVDVIIDGKDEYGEMKNKINVTMKKSSIIMNIEI